VARASSGTTKRRGRAGQLPTGTVAFLFTDIEGSTRLARSLPDAFPGLLDRHREILRGAFAEGIEVDSAGDAFFVAFACVPDAAGAAAEAQRRLAAEPWPEGGAVRVRMGLHAGIADLVGASYVGVEVHRAARVCAAAHGGQVLVSQAAAQLAEGSASSSVRPLGEYWLKDFDAAPEPLHQLVVEGLAESFPPPRTAEARVVSLPRENTSFVGREHELEDLQSLVIGNRLVTLTGEGGSGKTRLAVRIARDLAPRFRGPVVFVPLARVDEPDEAVQALAGALQLDGMIGTWEQAAEALESQNGLIVWDNAEHLPGLGDRLAMLRERCGRLHCLVTSRSPMALAGEQLYPVEPLQQTAAVDLLIDRARLLQPHFDVAASEPKLRRVADRLDGLPLALELAAARLRSLPVDALLERLDSQLDLLADAGRTRADRHQTMRNALQWSYDLVEPADRELFAALSVFAGPARLEAVAHVAGAEEASALDGLTRLIDASLVRLGDSPEPRYWMLEPVRQFAAERLAESDPERMRPRRMLEWYQATAASISLVAERIVREFRDERENLLRALTYSAELNEWEVGVALAHDVVDGVFGVGGTSESVVHWVAQAERRPLSARSRVALALVNVRRAGSQQAHAEHTLELARRFGDEALLVDALMDCAWVAIDDGRPDDADRALDEASGLCLEKTQDRVNLRAYRAFAAEIRGAPAEQYWAQAEKIAREQGDATDFVRTLWNLAGASLAHANPHRAYLLVTEALTADDSWESWPGTELALRYVAAVAALLDNRTREAAEHLQRALVVFDRVGPWDRLVDQPQVILTAAAVLIEAGDADAGSALYAWVEPDLADPPLFDTGAVGRQRELVESRRIPGPVPADREQAMRLALDGVATILAAADPQTAA
jgi:predicted ATPase/class 3 adenylate cyclase